MPYVFRRPFIASPLRRVPWRERDLASIEGTTCWGQTSGADETNALAFSGNWSGTGTTSGSGNAEKALLGEGEYLETDKTVHTGTVTVTLVANKYASGDAPTLKYRHGATDAAARAASWTVYSTPFASDGYVQLRIEN